MKGFIVIAESDDVNRERIRAILRNMEPEFEYEIAETAEQAIELVESRKPDVFVGDMNMPYISGTELFSMIERIAPETVRVVMTSARKVDEVVAFMNECRIFKLIVRPCRIAEDIVKPVEEALAYKEMNRRIERALEEVKLGLFSTQEDYRKMQETWQKNLDDYERVQTVFAELLECNLRLGKHPTELQEMLIDRYHWMMKEYVKDILDSNGNYETCVEYLEAEWKKFDADCAFEIRNLCKEPVQPEQMKKITFILQILRRTCGELLYHYDIRIVIEPAKKAYILRFLCEFDQDLKEENEETLFRIKEKEVRTALIKAAEKTVEAFDFKTVMLTRERDVIVNVAIPKRA